MSAAPDNASSRRTVRHNKIELALHELRSGSGRPLLLLHGLGERSPGTAPPSVDAWTGPVWALDFTGHGDSTVPACGGYTAEILLGDADAALGELGPCTVLGRGLGAYIALLIAGARPDLVRGAILTDGPGLAGGGTEPTSYAVVPIDAGPDPVGAPDPYALVDLTRDVRPPDYAVSFVRQALQLSGLDAPIAVSCFNRPEWIRSVVAEYGVWETTIEDALDQMAD